MKNLKLYLLVIGCAIVITGSSQAWTYVPLNFCGIEYSYDNAGNRTERQYVCNNDDRRAPSDSIIAQTQLTLLPNPTFGPLELVFNNEITNAQLTIIDYNGNVVYQSIVNGIQIPLNISNLAAGTYFITVNTPLQNFKKAVVKSTM